MFIKFCKHFAASQLRQSRMMSHLDTEEKFQLKIASVEVTLRACVKNRDKAELIGGVIMACAIGMYVHLSDLIS